METVKKSKKKVIIAIVCVVLVLAAAAAAYLLTRPAPFKDYDGDGVQLIVFLGDSITVSGRDGEDVSLTYPGLVATMLGEKYQVNNYGRVARCMMKSADNPYWEHPDFEISQSVNPDVVVIMLGTNDSRDGIWNAEAYAADTEEMVRIYQALPSQPTVYLITPPAVFEINGEVNIFGTNADVVANEIPPILRSVAEKTGAKIIDIFAATVDHPEYTPDGVHPNSTGIAAFADVVYAALAAE